LHFKTKYIDGNTKRKCNGIKEEQNKMEEKRVMVMEVEHATLRGGKAKPSPRDE